MNVMNVLANALKKIAQKNNDNPEVKTADPVVFEQVQKKWEAVENVETSNRSRADIYKEYREKILEAQQENEASPEIETADKSVFSDMLEEIERIKSTGVQSQEAPSHRAPKIDYPSASGLGVATTNSPGSIQMRMTPDMGAAKSDVWIPKQSGLQVLEYSTNTIILDGQTSRFALVEFQGKKGWVLEKYLNF